MEKQLELFPDLKEEFGIKKIIKRDGRVVDFDRHKIVNAVYGAEVEVGEKDRAVSEKLADEVIRKLQASYTEPFNPSVEDIQDIVENVLMEAGRHQTAKAYILYRAEHERIREKKDSIIRAEDNIPYRVLWDFYSWNVEHQCHSISALNETVTSGGWENLVLETEKKYLGQIHRAAEKMIDRIGELRLVIVAGPSSSGKTTTTTKIGEKLREKNKSFILMNLDNYYLNLESHPKDEYGDYDFETPKSLDLELINSHLEQLMRGKKIKMPFYDFKTGKRQLDVTGFVLKTDQILLIDSLHGLYDPMTMSVPKENKFKLYIEALCQIKEPGGEFVRWCDLRMLRRMIRDSWHRSYDPVRTIGHWHYVRRSEKKYIVPFINEADFIFNGALAYELPVHKKLLLQYLPQAIEQFRSDPKKLDAYMRASRVHNVLKACIDLTDEHLSKIPQNSLMREFIGGSSYKY